MNVAGLTKKEAQRKEGAKGGCGGVQHQNDSPNHDVSTFNYVNDEEVYKRRRSHTKIFAYPEFL